MADRAVHISAPVMDWVAENGDHLPGLERTFKIALKFLERDAALGRPVKDGRLAVEYPRGSDIPGLRRLIIVYAISGEAVRISGVWDVRQKTGLIEHTSP